MIGIAKTQFYLAKQWLIVFSIQNRERRMELLTTRAEKHKVVGVQTLPSDSRKGNDCYAD